MSTVDQNINFLDRNLIYYPFRYSNAVLILGNIAQDQALLALDFDTNISYPDTTNDLAYYPAIQERVLIPNLNDYRYFCLIIGNRIFPYKFINS